MLLGINHTDDLANILMMNSILKPICSLMFKWKRFILLNS